MRSRLKPNGFGSFHEYIFVQTGKAAVTHSCSPSRVAMVKCMRLIIGELWT